MMRSGALAALGRTEEAKVSVTDALRRFPNLTVEGFVNIPGFNEAERRIWAFAVSETKVASRTLRSVCHLWLLVNAITAKHTPAGATASLAS